MTTEVSQTTTNGSQKPKIKPAHDVVIEQAFELETLRAEVNRLNQETAEIIQERNQATVDFNQAISTLDESFDQFKSIDRLAAELKLCTEERDELRFDIAGLCGELAEEKQQRIGANSLLLETAHALGLDDSEVDELPQRAADLQTKLMRAKAHIESLALRISLEVVRGDELKEAYRQSKVDAELAQHEALSAAQSSLDLQKRAESLEVAVEAGRLFWQEYDMLADDLPDDMRGYFRQCSYLAGRFADAMRSLEE